MEFPQSHREGCREVESALREAPQIVAPSSLCYNLCSIF